MIKTVGIVSLSRGLLGEDFIKHELDLGIKRLEDYGLEVRFLPNALKATGIFNVINGIIVGKPQDESHYQAYKENFLEVIDADIPILYNVNVGHATPRAIVPFGLMAHVDAEEQVIRFED